MIQRLLFLAVFLGGAYWYWSGPYQERINPDYATILEENERKLEECIRAEAYRQGATGEGRGPEPAREYCADKHNLYLHDGRWHRYDMSRPDEVQ
jgi:hypothetical protein